jgi:chromate reductase, NAD(P)H dehydrogenase (quinone)
MSSATAAPIPGGAALEETNMVDRIKVLGFAGSLRQGSYNKAALRAAIELAPTDMTIEIFDLAPI